MSGVRPWAWQKEQLRTGLEGSAASRGEQAVDERRARVAVGDRPGHEAGQPQRLAFVERHRRFRLALLVPDAEAHVPLLRARAEVARHAQRPTSMGFDQRVRPEELDQLAAKRRRAPGTEAE